MQPVARYFRTFHTAARNPNRGVVFARLSCDQSDPYCGDIMNPGHGSFHFEH